MGWGSPPNNGSTAMEWINIMLITPDVYKKKRKPDSSSFWLPILLSQDTAFHEVMWAGGPHQIWCHGVWIISFHTIIWVTYSSEKAAQYTREDTFTVVRVVTLTIICGVSFWTHFLSSPVLISRTHHILVNLTLSLQTMMKGILACVQSHFRFVDL